MWAFASSKAKPAVCLTTLLLPVLFAVAAWPQQCDNSVLIELLPDLVANGERFLRCHHFSTTEQGVIAALDSDNAQVRVNAALVLLSHWPKEAAPPIEAAMLTESDELSRVHMAHDLTILGDNAGREMLDSECHRISEWGSTRMVAARYMSELHEDTCVDSVLDLLQSDSDPQDTMSKVEALELVPTFIDHLNGQDSRRVLELVTKALDDSDLTIRLTASNTLVRLGDVSAIPRLHAAIEREQDENIKSVMLSDVKRLAEQQQGTQSSEKPENATP